MRSLRFLRDFRRDPLAAFTTLHRDHGPIVRLPVPGFAFYLVSDPEAIQRALTRTHREYHKGISRRRDPAGPGIQPLSRVLGEGLLTSEATLHRRQRRTLQPMFHRARVAEYRETFAALAAQAVDGWTAGEPRDVHRDLTELTLAIIARTVFDVALDAEVITVIRTAIARHQPAMSRLASPVGRALDRLPLPSTRRWRRDQDEVNQLLYELIAARRHTPGGHDVLSLLLAARDPDTGEAMPDRQVRDEAMTLLLAGHETTANALAWALHLLAEHPTAQERARAELSTMDDDAPYLRAVWQETLRLFPPAWLQTRRLTEPDVVCGQSLPAGAMLLFSPWVVHRDARWWPEPDRFLPERWLAPAPERPRYAYFPFGGGPRQCIGNDFADLEGRVVLATVLRRWRVTPTPNAPPVMPQPLVTLRPRNGVTVTVHPPPRPR
jgi:cytochrome P450